MVQTDTIVGIVGAVVLVGVMAGVFVYEYNNQPGTDGGSGASGDFSQQYPALARDEDIDGDGVPNVEDDDLDGDGTPNDEDDDVVVVMDLGSATLDRHAPPLVMAEPVDIPVDIGTGIDTFSVSGEFTTTVPGAEVGIALLDSEGAIVAEETSSGGSLSLQGPAGMAPGQYTIRLTQEAPNDEVQVTGLTATAAYAGGAN